MNNVIPSVSYELRNEDQNGFPGKPKMKPALLKIVL